MMTSLRRGASVALRSAPANRFLAIVLQLCVVVLVAVLATAPAHAKKALETDDDKVVYFIGVLTAQQLEMLNLSKEEVALVIQAIEDTTAGNAIEIDREEISPKLRAFQEDRAQQALEVEKKGAAKFIEQQSKLKGAKVSESGLIYIEEKAGKGKQANLSDKVSVMYEGKLRDGTIFDKGTAEFPLEGVIQCWGECVSKMKVGGKAKLICPAEIAYGDRGVPPVIPPGAALAFDVELLEVSEGAPAPE
jgi:FKBP-type peptidyl-prolyl cis-trans isomerase FkpA